MDIQEVRGSQTEIACSTSEQAATCPGCASVVVPGDRFCQECGTRIGTTRSKRQVRESNESRAERTRASIICINCGTTNEPSSNECGDCKIPLIQQKERREDSRVERVGLRGSLTPRSTKRKRSDPTSAIDNASSNRATRNDIASSSIVPNAPVSNTLVSNASVLKTPVSSAPVSNASVSNTPVSKTDASITPESSAPTTTNPSDIKTEETRTNRKQRLPRFTRGADAFWFAGEKSNDQAALDFLYPTDELSAKKQQTEPFDQIIDESRKPSLFSLSAALFNIESLFERIPLPLVFLGVSLVIILASANATTQWNRHEQRLAAIDKIATNAENDMLTYRLDDAINTLQELEKTENGDLPPRARAILNQSLWLRSYARAKKQQYAKAIADLSAVTSTFISYDDVKEKSAEYKKLLAAHPEFADLSQTKSNEPATPEVSEQHRAKKKTIASSTEQSTPKRSKTDSADEAVLAQASERALRRVAAERAERVQVPQISPEEQSSEKSKPTVDKQKQPKTVSNRPDSIKADSTSAKKKKSGKTDAALLDADMKRYSGLLVEYFSKAESSRGSGQIAEPPSYEEWSEGGKRDF
ncbi:zinc ribbon domain-containing protein [Candidatus Obscuribacterales bacterium]|nr:zinc ribbon domain-containing protein [Candidatus Obscuribacterales bacterium]